jgi:hypothetical protein
MGDSGLPRGGDVPGPPCSCPSAAQRCNAPLPAPVFAPGVSPMVAHHSAKMEGDARRSMLSRRGCRVGRRGLPRSRLWDGSPGSRTTPSLLQGGGRRRLHWPPRGNLACFIGCQPARAFATPRGNALALFRREIAEGFCLTAFVIYAFTVYPTLRSKLFPQWAAGPTWTSRRPTKSGQSRSRRRVR